MARITLSDDEIVRRLSAGYLPYGDDPEDGSGRGVCRSTTGQAYFYTYEIGRDAARQGRPCDHPAGGQTHCYATSWETLPSEGVKAEVRHYTESGVAGPIDTIQYDGPQSVLDWSEGQIGHPWDGVIVTPEEGEAFDLVFDGDGYRIVED